MELLIRIITLINFYTTNNYYYCHNDFVFFFVCFLLLLLLLLLLHNGIWSLILEFRLGGGGEVLASIVYAYDKIKLYFTYVVLAV